jgi:APA family basic amino acid/polyamine antiporter
MIGRTLSARAVFAVVYTTAISSLYVVLGVIAHRALGLTPVVLLAAGLFFGLTALSYLEAAALHQEPGGSTVFSRYAFNELVSFVSGWAVALDYVILIALCALTATNYAATYWGQLGHGWVELVMAFAIIAFTAAANIHGLSARRLQQRAVIAAADLALQALIVALGLALVLDPSGIVDSIHLGTEPTWSNTIFALTIATVAFTGLEAAAGLSGEVRTSRRQLRRPVGLGALTMGVLYVGIAVVGLSALPVHDGQTALGGRYLEQPVVGIVSGFDPSWLADTLKYVVAAMATVSLVAAANSAMLGVSRAAVALATHRQIPSAVGRLHPTRGTPWIVIVLAAAVAAGLVAPTDLDFLVGIYAFGAMLAFTIAHAAVIVLRYREPERRRLYSVPLSVMVRGGSLPLPAVAGVILSAGGFISVLVLHNGARYVGLGWLAAGLVLYVVYRRSQETPLLERVTVPERALRVPAEAMEPEFGSILVPVFGTELDVDIIQTAGRLAGDERDDVEGEGAVIEALWVFELPMSLPLDARLPEAQLQRARQALARAKAVGEEYEGVEVATATVRARRRGQAIVDEARRRGVEAIVLAAEPPSRIRGGALLGGSGALDDYVGDVTKYVLRKAPCRVILTAPAVETPADGGDATRPLPAP